VNVDSSYFLDQKVNAYVQTLGFTGVERSTGSPITIGGVLIQTPTGDGSNAGYWNNLLATQVAQALDQATNFGKFVIDVKDNTVILISPSNVVSEKLDLIKGSNSSIGMTVNAPSGWVNGVWYGENPWSSFVGSSYFSPALVPVNVYSFGFTGGERSDGANVTVAGVTFTTPIAGSTNSGSLSNALARLHAEALNSSEVYRAHAVDVGQNTSILVTPRVFSDARINSFSGQSSPIGVSLNMPSGWSGGTWLGEGTWSSFFPPSYSLSARATSVDEGQVAIFDLVTKNLAVGTALPYTISGVSSSDVVGGQLSGSITVGSNGQTTITVPIVADLLTEGSESLTVTVQGQSASATVNDTSPTAQLASYVLSATSSSASEGATATFTLSTTNVTSGTTVPYTITGVSASDVVGGQLSGSVNVGVNGQATISVPLVADLFTEGPETLTVTAGGQSASVTVLDTPPSPLIPTYSLSASSASVVEGSVAVFYLTTTNIAAGNSVTYLISGVSEADVVGNLLSGSVTIDSNGRATISVPMSADYLTEGTETLRIIVSDKTATMAVADTYTTLILNPIFIYGDLKIYNNTVTNDVKAVVTKIDDITRIEGNQENNTLVGTDAIDRLLGGGGSDRFYSSKGNDSLDGGDGTDAVTYKGNASDFRVEKVGSNWQVRDTRTDPNVSQGQDTLTNVERVAFQDKVLALDTEGTSGKAYRVYKAAFNRDPMQGDTSGLGYWIGQMDSAMDLIEVSARFVDSKEFRDLYGTNPTNAQFLTKLYQNVLGRAPEATGYNWWLNELNTNPSKTKAKVLADFSESGENQTGVASLIGNGITYEPWVN
jgi:Ca2+-binding RTX toxin-like protein